MAETMIKAEMKMMVKVMHVVNRLNYAGLEMVVYNLIRQLDAKWTSSIICCLDDAGPFGEDLKSDGWPIIELGRRSGIDWLLPWRLARLMCSHQIDIVHTHNAAPYFYGTIAAKLARIPGVISTKHGNEERQSKRLAGLCYRLLSLLNNRVVTVSDELKNYLITRGEVSPAKVMTVVNGVDVDQYQIKIDRTGKRKELGLSETDFVVGHTARLSPVKDQSTLLKAIAAAMKVFPQIRLIIIGEGPLKAQLEVLADKLKISDKVFFLGIRRDMPEIFQIMDLFVLSSLNEGTSMTLLEAMAASLPIVATKVGGNPQIVKEGVTGLLVPVQDVEAMKRAVIFILKDRAKAEAMGEAGLRRVREKFSLKEMADIYERLYRPALAQMNKAVIWYPLQI
ncbi:MAG: glycosyltransferase [bacterium]|nr:glycosyltransferase [bacterium]